MARLVRRQELAASGVLHQCLFDQGTQIRFVSSENRTTSSSSRAVPLVRTSFNARNVTLVFLGHRVWRSVLHAKLVRAMRSPGRTASCVSLVRTINIEAAKVVSVANRELLPPAMKWSSSVAPTMPGYERACWPSMSTWMHNLVANLQGS